MPRSKTPSEKSSSQGRKVRTALRSTSGAGFDFEDHISALEMLKALNGEEMAGAGGSVNMIQAQVSALGWIIDDLLLTAGVGSDVRRLAISAKGNTQVSISGLPEDFVSRAWEQWRQPDGPFRRDRDGLALVTRGGHPAFDPTWHEVKNACAGGDVELALARIRDNARQSRVFDSVKKPDGSEIGTDAETIALIRSISVIPLDFQLDRSEAESRALADCRRLLSSGDPAEADDLWDFLLKLAKGVRLETGTLAIADLRALLRARFAMHQHPDYAQDWRTLTAITQDVRDRIETELPGGIGVERIQERLAIRQSIETNRLSLIFGESGSGKSALVKSVLDSEFENFNQVWLGPEELKTAASAARRGQLPLGHELSEVLNATAQPKNVLVIDSAERIEGSEYPVIRRVLEAIAGVHVPPDQLLWRIVVVTQPQGLAEIELSLAPGGSIGRSEVGGLSKNQVRSALLSSHALVSLSGQEDAVAALTNLRTLGWAMKAGARESTGGLTSHTAIADWLWQFWTKNRVDVQRLVMQLAVREAGFERSFAVTDLEAGDALTFTNRSSDLPLRKVDRTNRIEFQHDLAADWARFQYLKQIAHDIPQWVALARNPLWINALRLLGQFLLRQGHGDETLWDQAYRGAETAGNDLAGDILLDAICLDPNAEMFLTDRADLLLADEAKRLNRLLLRFHYTATVPSVGLNSDTVLSLHMESRFRSIVFSRWPGMLRFLAAHRRRLNGTVSSALAKVIHTWLTGAPTTFSDGTPMLLRREMAEIALDMARTIQVEKGQGVLYVLQDPALYTAALAAARDLPDEVGTWALELSGRRAVDVSVEARIRKASREKARIEDQRRKDDADYNQDYERRRLAARSAVPSFRQPLPPWPLGALKKVDFDFKNACFQESGLSWLMQTRSEIASEVLLALMIEDQPYDEYNGRHKPDLGLAFARDAYPTAFWKSPFFLFLQVAPAVALGTLVRLVDFCTDRWLDGARKEDVDELSVTLVLAGGSRKRFEGGFAVFDWLQTDSLHHGNLHCALDALERWLFLRLENGEDIIPDLERLFRDSHSAAALSILINIAKYQPALLTNVLAPLLTAPEILSWDSQRVGQVSGRFAALSWMRQGEAAFNFARTWTAASHRVVALLDVLVTLLRANDAFNADLQINIAAWALPQDPKEALEMRLIKARLDRQNYAAQIDPDTGLEAVQFAFPQALLDDVASWQASTQRPLRKIFLPDQCEELLLKKVALTDGVAAALAETVDECGNAVDDDDFFSVPSRSAAAATLIVCGGEWLARNPGFYSQLLDIIRTAIASVEGGNASRMRDDDGLRFIAHAVMHLWISGDDPEWEQAVLRILTSDNAEAAATLTAVAHKHRTELGPAWWRLVCAGVFWSGLSYLAPREGRGVTDVKAWRYWLERLRRYPLKGRDATSDDIDILRVADACGRLHHRRRMREYEAGDRRWLGMPSKEKTPKLDTTALDGLFSWLLRGTGTGSFEADRSLAIQIWAFDAARAKSGSKDYGEYDLPSQNLGYDVLVKLAELCLSGQKEHESDIWEGVLQHAPEAHYAVRHFIDAFFARLGNGADPTAFERVWRKMVEYGLAADWKKKGLWFHGERIVGDLMGFGNATVLRMLTLNAALRMKDVYQQWAGNHLAVDDEAVQRFANFLTTPFGSALRLEGMQWIKTALIGQKEYFFRENTGAALVELVATSLKDDGALLVNAREPREAIIDITAALVANDVPNALAIQERIRHLR